MKKTLIAVACAIFVSTGAYAKPAHNQPMHHNNHPVVHHQVSRPRPMPVVVRHRHPKPVVVHHHHHNHTDLGDILIAAAILATAL